MTDNRDNERPGIDPDDVAGAGESHLTDDLRQSSRDATRRSRREQLSRRIQGRAGQQARSELARSTVAKRADQMRGLVEIEAAQKIILDEPRPEDVSPEAEKRAARHVAMWFFTAAAGVCAFCAVFVAVGTDSLRSENALLGISLGVALFAVGGGLVAWFKRLMPHEEAVQMREELHPTEEERASFEIDFLRGLEDTGVTRRKILVGSMGLGTGLLVVPPLFLLSDLGPSPAGENGAGLLTYTTWRKDTRFVQLDSHIPVKMGDLAIGDVAAIMPEGHTSTDAQADSSIQLVRLRPDEIQMSYFEEYAKKVPSDQGVNSTPYSGTDFVIDGHIAFSRICTHAGCPVTCYMRQREVFLCPCHQSTFQANQAGRVVFGPAARQLPMLPFYVDDQGYFRAHGDFVEPIGPSFWERG